MMIIIIIIIIILIVMINNSLGIRTYYFPSLWKQSLITIDIATL